MSDRPCTCHPDEAPKPCQKKYALTHCQAARIERLEKALLGMVQAVCGETGFANAVRTISKTAYPWPALDIAEAEARAALEDKS